MTRALLAFALALSPAIARADDVEQCARAYEHGQELRLARRLSEAREQFLVCARPTCPKAARADCTRWLGEVEATLPAIVVRATRDARVLVDGKLAAEHADARPIALDPGKHVVRVEPAGCAPHEKEVTLTSGTVDVSFDVCGEARASVEAPAPVHYARRPPLATYVLGGVGLAALASFVAFGAVGVADANHLRDTCYPHCDPGAVDSANAELAVADASLGVAVACAAAALIVWLVAPKLVPQRALGAVGWRF